MYLFEFRSHNVYIIKNIKTLYKVDPIRWLSDLDANESVTEEFVHVFSGCSPYRSSLWIVSHYFHCSEAGTPEVWPGWQSSQRSRFWLRLAEMLWPSVKSEIQLKFWKRVKFIMARANNTKKVKHISDYLNDSTNMQIMLDQFPFQTSLMAGKTPFMELN